MSFDKEYANRKDWRKPYRKSKVFDRSCRNHGSCGYCYNDRTFSKRKTKNLIEQDLKDYNAQA